MRGVFKNPKGHLKSGLFVRIRLPEDNPHKAWLIPDEAVQSDQGRKYVFVVQPDRDEEDKVVTDKEGRIVGHVEYRVVTLGKSIEELREIKVGSPDDARKKDKLKKEVLTEKELKNGARIIIRGMQRVREGAEVRAQMEDPPQSPHAPLTDLLAGKGPVAR
jgi:multidrug efflux pump subunit AcrA (membrane-fusion protein)